MHNWHMYRYYLGRECLLSAWTLKTILRPLSIMLLLGVLLPLAMPLSPPGGADMVSPLLWIAFLLSIITTTESLCAPDIRYGIIHRLVALGVSAPMIISAKWITHLLTVIAPLLGMLALLHTLLSPDNGAPLAPLLLLLLLSAPLLSLLSLVTSLIMATRGIAHSLSFVIILPLILPLCLIVSSYMGGAITFSFAAACLVGIALISLPPLFWLGLLLLRSY